MLFIIIILFVELFPSLSIFTPSFKIFSSLNLKIGIFGHICYDFYVSK